MASCVKSDDAKARDRKLNLLLFFCLRTFDNANVYLNARAWLCVKTWQAMWILSQWMCELSAHLNRMFNILSSVCGCSNHAIHNNRSEPHNVWRSSILQSSNGGINDNAMVWFSIRIEKNKHAVAVANTLLGEQFCTQTLSNVHIHSHVRLCSSPDSMWLCTWKWFVVATFGCCCRRSSSKPVFQVKMRERKSSVKRLVLFQV